MLPGRAREIDEILGERTWHVLVVIMSEQRSESRPDALLSQEQEEKLGLLLSKAGLQQYFHAFVKEKVCS